MAALYSLSKREVEVLILLAERLTISQIAAILFRSPHTIRTHRNNIRTRLNVSDILSAVILAHQLGIISVMDIRVRLSDPEAPQPTFPDHNAG